MLEVLFGRGAHERRARMTARYGEQVRAGRGGEILYLVATPALREAVRRDLLASGARFGRLNLFLFADLVDAILAWAGIERRDLGPAGAHALLRRAVRELEEEGALAYFRDMARRPGFLRAAAALLGELRRAGARPERFSRAVAGMGEKLEDLARIYGRYQLLMERGGWADREERALLALEALERGDGAWFSSFSELLVEGFTGMAPVQWAIVSWAARRIPRGVVNVDHDPSRPRFHRRSEAFLGLWRALGPGVALVGPGEGRPGAEAGGAAWPLPPEPVRVLVAADPEQEARAVAREVKLLLQEGVLASPADAAVVVREGPAAGPRIARALERAGVPCQPLSPGPLGAVPAVRFLQLLAEVAAAPDRVERLISLLGSDYAACDAPAGFAPARALAALGRPRSLEELLERCRARVAGLEGEAALAGDDEAAAGRILREKQRLEEAAAAVERLGEALALFPERGTVSGMTAALARAAEMLGFPERVLAAVDGGGNGLDLYARDARAVAAFWAALEEAGRADPGPVTRAEFARLTGELAGMVAAPRPAAPGGGVRIVEAAQARGLRIPVVFVAGLVDGEFPRRFAADWLCPDPVRRELAARGIPLETREDLAAGEPQLFAQAAACALRRLYLTASRSDGAGGRLLLSPFLDEMREQVPPDRWRHEDLAPEPAVPAGPEGAASLPELEGLVLRRRRRAGLGTPGGAAGDGPLWAALERRLREAGRLRDDLLWRVAAEDRREAPEFGPWDGCLSDRVAAMTAASFGPGHVHSPSALEDYARCPFLYFCGRVLRLAPPEEAADQAERPELGRLAHAILARFYRRQGGRSLADRDPEELRRELEEEARPVLERFEAGSVSLHPALWRLDRAGLMRRLHALVLRDAETARATGGRMRPRFLEVRFGPCPARRPGDAVTDAEPDPASVPDPLLLGDVRVAGAIDRVDVAEDGRFVVLDYKFGRVPQTREILEGLDLQVGIYILAARRLLLPDGEAVGGGYVGIGDGERNQGLWRADCAEYHGVGRRALGSMEAAEWEAALAAVEQRVAEFAAAIRKGLFPVAPRDCREGRCDYRDVCRYQRWLAARKKGATAGGD